MKFKILFESKDNSYIVKFESGEFAGLYARVDLADKKVWPEALVAMFFKWDPYAEWKPWAGEYEKEICKILENTELKATPEVKQYLTDPEYRAFCDKINSAE